MAQILFKNANLLDPHADSLQGGVSVLVEGESIREVSAKPIQAGNADVIDCKGRTLMPGLIDCHVHVMLSEVNIRYLEAIPLTMMTVRAAALARAMIDRGFTTVRDIGPTGGHSDARRRTDTGSVACKCCNAMRFCLEVVDGVDAVRAAVREQLRQGVDQIKIMVSGGVASPYDPLDSRQFSLDEIRTAVEEADAFGRYTQAHAYTAEAITRAVSQGVRTIEHGNLI
ncbi:MAG: amidohydrolase family protein, partial [Betaproteobacteria bacterium]